MQLELLGLTKSTYYYERKEPSSEETNIKQLISDIYEDMPFYGHRRVWRELKDSDVFIGRDRTLKYMRDMGLKPIYPEPKTTMANKEHKKYPYLLKNLEITRPNQVWASDITYLKIGSGHVYFTGVIDWYTRKILSYRISNTLDAYSCIEALEEAIAKYGVPEIFNTDQGSQYTSKDFINVLEKNKIKISMDSVGRWADNIIIERFFRTLKYEYFYIKKYETITALKTGIKNYIKFYNERRKHSSLGYSTPAIIYKNYWLIAA